MVSEIASRSQIWAALFRRAVFTVPLILLLGLASGWLSQSGDENRWYRALEKPDFLPPSWAFPLVWSVLYILLGLALALVWNARGARQRGGAIGWFAAQMAMNLAWSPLFFAAHQVTAALWLVVLLLVTAAVTTWKFAQVRRTAALLMLPYLAWLGLATALNWEVDRRNPDAESLVPPGSSTQIPL